MQIITFSGVDCAGKTTQIEMLRNYLLAQKKTVKIFWYRPGYSEELEAIKKILRKALPITQKKASAKVVGKANVSQKAPGAAVAVLWIGMALVDTFVQWAIKLRALSHRYDVVILDRYIDDAILDLKNKYPHALNFEHILKAMDKFFPRIDARILLMLSYETMLARMQQKLEPFPDPPQLRDKRYDAYVDLARDPHYHVVDAERSPEDVHKEILAILQAFPAS